MNPVFSSLQNIFENHVMLIQNLNKNIFTKIYCFNSIHHSEYLCKFQEILTYTLFCMFRRIAVSCKHIANYETVTDGEGFFHLLLNIFLNCI